jgi:hypothetical protein
MKRKVRRLHLAKETILKLQEDQLRRARGQAPRCSIPSDVTQDPAASLCVDTIGPNCSDYPSVAQTDCTICPSPV